MKKKELKSYISELKSELEIVRTKYNCLLNDKFAKQKFNIDKQLITYMRYFHSMKEENRFYEIFNNLEKEDEINLYDVLFTTDFNRNIVIDANVIVKETIEKEPISEEILKIISKDIINNINNTPIEEKELSENLKGKIFKK